MYWCCVFIFFFLNNNLLYYSCRRDAARAFVRVPCFHAQGRTCRFPAGIHTMLHPMCLIHGYITVRTYIYRWMGIIIIIIIIHMHGMLSQTNVAACPLHSDGILQISVVEMYLFMHELVLMLVGSSMETIMGVLP